MTLADFMVFSMLHYQHTLETLENAKYRYEYAIGIRFAFSKRFYRFLSRWAYHIRQLPAVTAALKDFSDFDFQGWSDVMKLVGSQANFEFLELPVSCNFLSCSHCLPNCWE